MKGEEGGGETVVASAFNGAWWSGSWGGGVWPTGRQCLADNGPAAAGVSGTGDCPNKGGEAPCRVGPGHSARF
jgi:hypothetical protein